MYFIHVKQAEQYLWQWDSGTFPRRGALGHDSALTLQTQPSGHMGSGRRSDTWLELLITFRVVCPWVCDWCVCMCLCVYVCLAVCLVLCVSAWLTVCMFVQIKCEPDLSYEVEWWHPTLIKAPIFYWQYCNKNSRQSCVAPACLWKDFCRYPPI